MKGREERWGFLGDLGGTRDVEDFVLVEVDEGDQDEDDAEDDEGAFEAEEVVEHEEEEASYSQ